MQSRGKKPTAGEPVLDRAVRLLETFDTPGEALALTDLARRAAVPKSTALRLCRQMTGLGLLERESDGRFVIGIHMLELGSLASRGNGIRSIAMPYLEELHRATGNYVLLGVRNGDEAVLVERLSPIGPSSDMYLVGKRMPLAATGLGLALLAFAPPEFQARYLARSPMIEPEGTRIDPEALSRHLVRIRSDGYATVSRSIGPRWASVGCPIWRTADDPIAAISVVAPPGELAPASVRTAVMAIAGVISRELTGPNGTRRPGGSRAHFPDDRVGDP